MTFRSRATSNIIIKMIRSLSDDYKQAKWYRDMNRNEVREFLKGVPNGYFIVRPSSKSDFYCTLSVSCNEKLYNLGIKIDEETQLFYLSSTVDHTMKFQNVKQLVEYYTTNPLSLYFEGEQVLVPLRYF